MNEIDTYQHRHTRIHVLDDLHPEDVAMLQALQSRSPASVEERLAKVREAGSGNFMDRYYVGYGHKSIGDCGTTTIFLEGVSMLAAKAIQDWPLYSGQEASTRYMDFSTAEFIDPVGTAETREIQECWRKAYLDFKDPLVEQLRSQYPRQEEEDEKTYERAISARAFDVLRSLLPAGASTNLSWHTNLRQAEDHLRWLVVHPDPLVADLGWEIHVALRKKYPHSFNREQEEDTAFRRRVMQAHYYVEPFMRNSFYADFKETYLSNDMLGLLQERPRGVEMPWFMAEYGMIQSCFHLDFGSFRDLQRHRNGTIRMPLLTTQLGFHPWYLEAFGPEVREIAQALLFDQDVRLKQLDVPPVLKQYYIAMGYQVMCRVNQSLPAFVYRLELRSSKTVHPTLRRVVHEEIRQFQERFKNIPLHVDMDPDSWTVRRGKQTITEKT